MSEFKVGDRVRWTSQSQGSSKAKVGTVARIIPPRSRTPDEIKNPGLSRDHESYLIEADKPRTCRYYWPRVSALSPA